MRRLQTRGAVKISQMGFESLEPRVLLVGTITEQIIVDQFGWRSDAVRKIAVFSDPINGQNAAVSYTPGSSFQIRRTGDDAVMFTGAVAAWKAGQTDTVSGDKAWWGDFSTFTTPGEYYLYDPTNNLRSYTFALDSGVFDDVLKTSIRTFYYQRVGTAIGTTHGANWTHAAGHVGPNQDHAARLWTGSNQGQPRDLWGGWYDAGDYNKYVPFTTGVLWNLLTAFEWNPSAFPDNTNIPESGNGAPDLLDEVKWETDWLMRMQNVNGSVLNRVANATYAAGNHDPSTDTQPRYYTQATTWATASFAASLAHASRVFANYESVYPGYAQALRTAAENAWSYLVATPNMTPSTGLDGGGSGGSNGVSGGLAAAEGSSDANGDRRLRVLAAAELYKTTGSSTYKSYFEANYRNSNTSENGFHPLLDANPRFDASAAGDLNKAYVTYAQTTGANTTIVNEIKQALRNTITFSWLAVGEYNNQTDPYRAFMWSGHYTWGSNQIKSDWANLLMYAVKLNVGTQAERDKAREVAEEYLHYFHGRNPLSMVYLSNTGTHGANIGADKSPQQVYHSWFGDGSALYDGGGSTYGPVPGYLVGGPNQYFSVGTITPPAGEPPMKAFKDWNTGWPENSWEITEPAIYYQAAYSLLASHFTSAPFALLNGGQLTITGTFADDTFLLAATATDYTVSLNGGVTLSFAKASVNSIEVVGLAGADALCFTLGNVTAPFTFLDGAGADSLAIASGAFARAGALVNISTMSISPAGGLDLDDHDLVLDYTGASQLGAVQSLINSGRNGGAWDGFGITSTAARANAAGATTLGAMESAGYLALYGGNATFAGQSIDASSVLVKYTYYGDADFNGLVDFDDYVRIDAGYNAGLGDWFNGDFDGSGSIDFDDYVLIDLAYNAQSEIL